LAKATNGSGHVLVVARQKDDPMAALDDRIGSQGERNQVIEPFTSMAPVNAFATRTQSGVTHVSA
jgi:hypothetical protein